MLHALHFVLLARRNINELPLAEAEAGLVIDLHHPDHLCVGEAERAQAVRCDAADGEEGVTRVDGVGDPFAHPEGGSSTALCVTIFNIVMHQTEVMAELNSCGSRDGALPVAGERCVGEQPEEWPHPLPKPCGRIAVAHVIADLVVHVCGDRLLPLREEFKDRLVRCSDEHVKI